MIYLIEGVPGSGKSFYGMQKHLIPAFQKGKNIYTNIAGLKPLNICALYQVDTLNVDYLHFADPSEIDKIRSWFSQSTLPNSLLIVDELQNYFNSRDFKESHARNVIDYLTQHRHYGHTIVGITQSIDSVDITFRRNASQVYRLTNMGYVGLRGKAKIHYYESADTTKKPIATSVLTYDARVFKCYESVEQGSAVVHTKFIFPKKIIFVIAVFVFFLFAANKLMKFTKPQNKPVKQTETHILQPISADERDSLIENGIKICFGGKCVK